MLELLKAYEEDKVKVKHHDHVTKKYGESAHQESRP